MPACKCGIKQQGYIPKILFVIYSSSTQCANLIWYVSSNAIQYTEPAPPSRSLLQKMWRWIDNITVSACATSNLTSILKKIFLAWKFVCLLACFGWLVGWVLFCFFCLLHFEERTVLSNSFRFSGKKMGLANGDENFLKLSGTHWHKEGKCLNVVIISPGKTYNFCICISSWDMKGQSYASWCHNALFHHFRIMVASSRHHCYSSYYVSLATFYLWDNSSDWLTIFLFLMYFGKHTENRLSLCFFESLYCKSGWPCDGAFAMTSVCCSIEQDSQEPRGYKPLILLG